MMMSRSSSVSVVAPSGEHVWGGTRDVMPFTQSQKNASDGKLQQEGNRSM